MDPLLPQDNGSTPLDPDERLGLLPAFIATRSDLNSAEQANIAKARHWAFRRKNQLFSIDYLNDLHKQMFGEVWNWAGKFRQTERNIGVAPIQIAVQMRELIHDVRYWIEHDTYVVDEVAARFHHRLVQIHPYPNGNGRHARLATDILLKEQGEKLFTWGQGLSIAPGEIRQRYINALRSADNYDLEPLLDFVRS